MNVYIYIYIKQCIKRVHCLVCYCCWKGNMSLLVKQAYANPSGVVEGVNIPRKFKTFTLHVRLFWHPYLFVNSAHFSSVSATASVKRERKIWCADAPRLRPEIRSTALPFYARIPPERIQHNKSLSKTSSTLHKNREWMDGSCCKF